jgi:hypothetical protein
MAVTVTAPARPERLWGLPATLRVAVALVAAVTVMVVGLAGLFASPASAHTLTRPGNAVGAFGVAGGQVVGAHPDILAGQRRARAPSYDPTASGSCVAAETDTSSAAACGGLSFAAGTPVLLADGTSAPISQLTVSDQVVATNTTTGKTQAEPVAAVLVHHDTNLYDLTVQSGGVPSVIHTTSNHLFWDQTTRSWTQAAKLRDSDKLRSPTAGTTTIVVGGAAPVVTTGVMWDLTVTADHDFYIDTTAATVLVHNADECGPQSISPNDIQFSQSSVNGAAEKIAAMQTAGGWVGDPIDVVEMEDGSLTSVDNTRLLAARETGFDVQANVHAFDESLPEDQIERFTSDAGSAPSTWGEAVLNRIGDQASGFRNAYPFGSPYTGWSGN